MHYYLQALKKYAVFSGRAQRAEFWYFFLFNLIIIKILQLITVTIFIRKIPYIEPIGLLYPIFFLLIIIPTITVGVRRLHDIGKNGWRILLFLIPLPLLIFIMSDLNNVGHLGIVSISMLAIVIISFISSLWIPLLLATDSSPGENKYGPNPKGVFTKPDISNENLTKKEKIMSWVLCIPFPLIAGFILYHMWKKDAPMKAKQANRISFLALGLDFLAFIGISMLFDFLF